jgi:hypothetical protein
MSTGIPLFDMFSTAPAYAAAGDITSGINKGVGQAVPQFQQGIGAIQQNYGAALPAWMQNVTAANQGVNALSDALGLGGPAGSGRAVQAFMANPGIGYAIQQGDNAATAAAAASGTLNSGNTTQALAKVNQGIASQGWNNYVSQLMPYLNFATAGAGGLGGTYMGLGNQLATQYGNLGNLYYGANTSIGNAQANAALSPYTVGANDLNALLGVGTFGAKLAGGGFGPPSAIASDERVKEDIEPVGVLADGQTVYRYRYIGEPATRIGLIAQETDPEAVAEILPGILGVDYRRATDRASALMRIATSANDDRPTSNQDYASELWRSAA